MNHSTMLETAVDLDDFELDVKTSEIQSESGSEQQMTSGIGCMCCPF